MKMKKHTTEKRYKFESWITEDIKYKRLVAGIMDNIEDRVVEICKKFAKGNVNNASLPAFWIGLQGDIDEILKRELRKLK